jgi:hypothetical protein
MVITWNQLSSKKEKMEIACIQKLEEKGRHESIVKAAVSDLRALRAGNGGRN